MYGAEETAQGGQTIAIANAITHNITIPTLASCFYTIRGLPSAGGSQSLDRTASLRKYQNPGLEGVTQRLI